LKSDSSDRSIADDTSWVSDTCTDYLLQAVYME